MRERRHAVPGRQPRARAVCRSSRRANLRTNSVRLSGAGRRVTARCLGRAGRSQQAATSIAWFVMRLASELRALFPALHSRAPQSVRRVLRSRPWSMSSTDAAACWLRPACPPARSSCPSSFPRQAFGPSTRPPMGARGRPRRDGVRVSWCRRGSVRSLPCAGPRRSGRREAERFPQRPVDAVHKRVDAVDNPPRVRAEPRRAA